MTSLNSAGNTGDTRTVTLNFSPPAILPFCGYTSTNPFFLTYFKSILNSNVTLPVFSIVNSLDTHSQKRTSPNSIKVVLILEERSELSPTKVTSYSGPPST